MKKILFLAIALVAGFFAYPALAHQPRVPNGENIIVLDPEISKAYYSQLNGQAQVYTINSDQEFALYVNILVPDLPGQKTDLKAVIAKSGESQALAILDGTTFNWTSFFEPFGYDRYLMGPEYKATVSAGEYKITVSNPGNDSKYSLAIGEAEAFDFKETYNALKLIPQIKKNFFNESPVNFIFSPFGYGLIIIMYILGFAVGWLYRFILKKLAKPGVRTRQHNIGAKDRLLRLAIAIGLLVWAITTGWQPILLFLSGFTLFEAIFSWCGFYAAMGKNTCPL